MAAQIIDIATEMRRQQEPAEPALKRDAQEAAEWRLHAATAIVQQLPEDMEEARKTLDLARRLHIKRAHLLDEILREETALETAPA